jgi:prepilin-type N-terminal cleavage/methylation domain-containing protein
MSFNNIKSKSQLERGFTIVELLIVIVVIGILAAITIVSYNGITARANTNSAKANATAFLKKAELHAADGGSTGALLRYPITAAEMQTASDASKSFYVNTSLVILYQTALMTTSTPNLVNSVRVLKCGSGSPANQAAVIASNVNGLKAFYWDFAAGTEIATPLSVGDTTTCPAS